MKVWELEEALSSLDKNLEVVMPGEDGFGYLPLDNIEETKAILHEEEYNDGLGIVEERSYELDNGEGSVEVVVMRW
ncbi:hypothetical protein A2Z67_04615 [Candidatus Woesebacteria bacterium RBG_13_36_22]|uniref:Uncharacterized protein n=1 Tax=Candidatus Woesebacteria bacterium RBG_13_36_22 TaxID=1802478 RepID=A0A1F7X4H6_9BACT|nr:MAG: hypothetical protein A2Z67_04615 [Candidatus Woesebacteria bacterium RBG_13_36_22]